MAWRVNEVFQMLYCIKMLIRHGGLEPLNLYFTSINNEFLFQNFNEEGNHDEDANPLRSDTIIATLVVASAVTPRANAALGRITCHSFTITITRVLTIQSIFHSFISMIQSCVNMLVMQISVELVITTLSFITHLSNSFISISKSRRHYY